MHSLNPEQRLAVEHGEGPLLILAGAGSGKTRVITRRIASLIERGTEASSIVAVSFTNKAANEMAERMVPLVGRRRASQLRTSTFHSFGLDLLKQYDKRRAGRGRFVVFDQSDSLGLVKELLRERYRGGATRRLDPASILARISNWKTAMVAPGDVPESDHEYDVAAAEIYPEYDARLEAMRAFDFDDLVCRPVHLLRRDPSLRSEWRARIEHLLVDEFQDTSGVQLELVKLLANERRNVCVVGDDDQSIYGWRGADLGNILEFTTHFPGARVIKLETNYRSRQPILEVANAVIGNSGSRRHPKVLHAARSGGDPVHVSVCENPAAEARFVAGEIRRLRSETRVPLGEIAVLYRSNLQARPIEEELKAGGIAYRLFGGQQFFDRREVKDVAAYLRLIVNPHDEISLRRVIQFPSRGIGTRTVQRIGDYATASGTSFTRAFETAPQLDGIPDRAKRSIAALLALVDDSREQFRKTGRLHAAACALVERLDLHRALDDTLEGGKQGPYRYQNVLALLEWLRRYEERSVRTHRSLQDFLQRVTLNGDPPQDEERTGEGVTLCTLHAAKGLEFGIVFLIGCIEGQLPHVRTTDPKASEAVATDLDEERRLFYVGITRARDRLYLTAPRQRSLRGKTVDVTRSRYVEELPPGFLREYSPPEEEELSREELGNLARELRDRLRGGGGSAELSS